LDIFGSFCLAKKEKKKKKKKEIFFFFFFFTREKKTIKIFLNLKKKLFLKKTKRCF